MKTELGNTPADKNYKPSGIVNNLIDGATKAVQLPNGTLVTEELSKSMTRAQEAALNAFPGQQFIHDRCVFRFGYEQAEKDLALTWKDMRKIIRIDEEMMDDPEAHPEWMEEQPFYEEMLRRFKEAKK